ncbi:hypothetical protein PR048_029752 [Dryococelus australis]|uniref:SFR19-like C-terminal domain-containing protein n=1 Tax=Dryococelus australis TaxID=614101 RepID=A0ABQ9GE95_9NEOP|nr:hypothetical protein PR048_029752 [Dryococelus australis]
MMDGDLMVKHMSCVGRAGLKLVLMLQFLKKLNRQERVVEEVKLSLKPHYTKKHITKEEYKDILRRSVPKVGTCPASCSLGHMQWKLYHPLSYTQLVEGSPSDSTQDSSISYHQPSFLDLHLNLGQESLSKPARRRGPIAEPCSPYIFGIVRVLLIRCTIRKVMLPVSKDIGNVVPLLELTPNPRLRTNPRSDHVLGGNRPAYPTTDYEVQEELLSWENQATPPDNLANQHQKNFSNMKLQSGRRQRGRAVINHSACICEKLGLIPWPSPAIWVSVVLRLYSRSATTVRRDQPRKIATLVEAYVKKYRYHKKKSLTAGLSLTAGVSLTAKTKLLVYTINLIIGIGISHVQPRSWDNREDLGEESFSQIGLSQVCVLTDNGAKFIARQRVQACCRWEAENGTIPTYNPQANPTESQNQEINMGLWLHTYENCAQWDSHIREILFRPPAEGEERTAQGGPTQVSILPGPLPTEHNRRPCNLYTCHRSLLAHPLGSPRHERACCGWARTCMLARELCLPLVFPPQKQNHDVELMGRSCGLRHISLRRRVESTFCVHPTQAQPTALVSEAVAYVSLVCNLQFSSDVSTFCRQCSAASEDCNGESRNFFQERQKSSGGRRRERKSCRAGHFCRVDVTDILILICWKMILSTLHLSCYCDSSMTRCVLPTEMSSLRALVCYTWIVYMGLEYDKRVCIQLIEHPSEPRLTCTLYILSLLPTPPKRTPPFVQPANVTRVVRTLNITSSYTQTRVPTRTLLSNVPPKAQHPIIEVAKPSNTSTAMTTATLSSRVKYFALCRSPLAANLTKSEQRGLMKQANVHNSICHSALHNYMSTDICRPKLPTFPAAIVGRECHTCWYMILAAATGSVVEERETRGRGKVRSGVCKQWCIGELQKLRVGLAVAASFYRSRWIELDVTTSYKFQGNNVNVNVAGYREVGVTCHHHACTCLNVVCKQQGAAVFREWTNGIIGNNQRGNCGAPRAIDVTGERRLQRCVKANRQATVEQLTVQWN